MRRGRWSGQKNDVQNVFAGMERGHAGVIGCLLPVDAAVFVLDVEVEKRRGFWDTSKVKPLVPTFAFIACARFFHDPINGCFHVRIWLSRRGIVLAVKFRNRPEPNLEFHLIRGAGEQPPLAVVGSLIGRCKIIISAPATSESDSR